MKVKNWIINLFPIIWMVVFSVGMFWALFLYFPDKPTRPVADANNTVYEYDNNSPNVISSGLIDVNAWVGSQPHYLVIGGSEKGSIKIDLKTYDVELPPDMNVNEASKVFWDAIKQYIKDNQLSP